MEEIRLYVALNIQEHWWDIETILSYNSNKGYLLNYSNSITDRMQPVFNDLNPTHVTY